MMSSGTRLSLCCRNQEVGDLPQKIEGFLKESYGFLKPGPDGWIYPRDIPALPLVGDALNYGKNKAFGLMFGEHFLESWTKDVPWTGKKLSLTEVLHRQKRGPLRREN